MNSNRILVVEDDPDIRMGLVDTLESEGYQVLEAENGLKALKLFKLNDNIDLLLLDIMMPEKSGFDVLREIRLKNNQVPVIMLTAKGEEIDKVLGLELGADDYITKPFGIHELLARISAVLRRSNLTLQKEVDNEDTKKLFGGHSIDFKRYKLVKNDAEFDLSDREIKLIKIFQDHPEEVLSRDFLLDQVWGIDYPGTTRTLDQHIAQLRKKIEDRSAEPKVITTVHGIGYRYQP